MKNRDDEQLWILDAPISFRSTKLDMIITVPQGFVTDFASVPRLPVVYNTLANIAQRAAVIHDYLYSTASVPRVLADKILLEAMEASGVSWIKRKAIYLGVRVGGASHYG